MRIRATKHEYLVDYARCDEDEDYKVLAVSFGSDSENAFVWAESLNDSLEYRPLMVRRVTTVNEAVRIF